MEKLVIRPYRNEDEQEVIDLWFACRLVVPANNPKRDIERKLLVNPELFLVNDDVLSMGKRLEPDQPFVFSKNR